jgi:Transposase
VVNPRWEPLAAAGLGVFVSPMDENLRSKAVGSPRGLVRFTARRRQYSPAARLAILEESYATDARVADTAVLHGISCSQMHARRKKYDGRDGAGEDCRELVSFAWEATIAVCDIADTSWTSKQSIVGRPDPQSISSGTPSVPSLPALTANSVQVIDFMVDTLGFEPRTR